MKKIALVYSYNSTKSAKIAHKIAEIAKNIKLDQINVEETKGADLLKYDGLILSVPTWFDGELPNYWDEILPELESLSFTKRKVALYGLGDQKNYPENFCDAVGILADYFKHLGAEIIGFTSTEGYQFESSRAVKNNNFCGLLLDQENQAKLTDNRLQNWLLQLEKEFN